MHIWTSIRQKTIGQEKKKEKQQTVNKRLLQIHSKALLLIGNLYLRIKEDHLTSTFLFTIYQNIFLMFNRR